jgi:hypothetical protein
MTFPRVAFKTDAKVEPTCSDKSSVHLPKITLNTAQTMAFVVKIKTPLMSNTVTVNAIGKNINNGINGDADHKILHIFTSLFLVKESGLKEGCKVLVNPPGSKGTFSKSGKIAIVNISVFLFSNEGYPV